MDVPSCVEGHLYNLLYIATFIIIIIININNNNLEMRNSAAIMNREGKSLSLT